MVDRQDPDILEEIEFLQENSKWGGAVQVLRVTVVGADGRPRTFINKRLIFDSNGRYVNLPRHGIEEIVEAIQKASLLEAEHHAALISELNESRPATSRRADSSRGTPPSHNNGQGRHGNNSRGDHR